MADFWEECHLRKGEAFNPGWCGTCAIPQETLKRIVQEQITKLRTGGHSCFVVPEDGTVFWWCGEDTCKPENAIQRKSCAVSVQEGDEWFIDITPDQEHSKDDFDRVKWGHGTSCLVKVSDTRYKWCGQRPCQVSVDYSF